MGKSVLPSLFLQLFEKKFHFNSVKEDFQKRLKAELF